jgi:non-specific serine/threonine protein kinase
VSDFEIIGLIGEGGFGIVYLARDISLDRIVALKEFMPAAFAGRIDGVHVAVRAANHRGTFDAGLKSFINESKMLAKFAHPALVEVFRFWEGNGTAYMAMRLYRGDTLRQVLSKGETEFTEDGIAQIMGPIFDALEMLHREQVFHRDIAPDNIIVSDGRSVLLDFGSARKIIGDATQALTTVLKPGYAPLEQYSDDGTMKQGAWTDVYALGGVLYHLATGKVPLQAVSRMLTDPLQTINQVTGDRFSATFSQAVSKAMNVHVDNRFQTVTEFREALCWNVGLQPRVVTLPSAPRVWLDPESAPKTGPASITVPVTTPVIGSSSIENAVPKTGNELPGTTSLASVETVPEQGMPAATLPAKPVGGVKEPIIRGERAAGTRTVAPVPKKSTGLVATLVAAALVVAGVVYWQTRAPTKLAASDVAASVPTAAAEPAGSAATPAASAPSTTPGAVSASGNTSTETAPVAAAAEGLVKFDIKPRGRIDIDGVTSGFSPPLTERRLSVGKHTIEIINPPAATVSRTIEVTESTPVTVTHTFK